MSEPPTPARTSRPAATATTAAQPPSGQAGTGNEIVLGAIAIALIALAIIATRLGRHGIRRGPRPALESAPASGTAAPPAIALAAGPRIPASADPAEMPDPDDTQWPDFLASGSPALPR